MPRWCATRWRRRARADVGPVSLWCAPETGHPFFAACAARYGVALHAQRGGHLGERMARAFDAAARRGPGGARGLRLPLRRRGGPARGRGVARHARGGGAARRGRRLRASWASPAPSPGLFEGIRWGEASVMRETRLRLRAGERDVARDAGALGRGPARGLPAPPRLGAARGGREVKLRAALAACLAACATALAAGADIAPFSQRAAGRGAARRVAPAHASAGRRRRRWRSWRTRARPCCGRGPPRPPGP